ncbi:HD domain-containing protein [bacterium]|nr:HD domain-containing protein [bacterium]
MIKLKDIKENPIVRAFILVADKNLEAMGYTEHGFRHADLTANIARNILLRLGYSEREAELAAISGYLHDIGNVVNREGHCIAGAMIAYEILHSLGMPLDEIAQIMSAIGNHDEESGYPISNISAALIIADKSDVHYTRVRNPNPSTFDIHDRVNFAVHRSFLNVDNEAKKIRLELDVDTNQISIMEYFEIFLQRMLLCKRAADVLGCNFRLVINQLEM